MPPTQRLYFPADALITEALSPAFSNQYVVRIDFGNKTKLRSYLTRNQNTNSIALAGGKATDEEYIGILCTDALLPGSSFDVSEVKGLRQGITNKYAMQRIYPDIDLTFYIDQDYFLVDFFNNWMEFISPTYKSGEGLERSANFNNVEDASYKRLQYPDYYKCDLQISAFNKGLLTDQSKLNKPGAPQEPSNIRYFVKKAFPKNVVSTPLKYGPADLMRVTVSFTYEMFFTQRKVRKTNILEIPINNPL
jgi:hypothetical protein